MKNLFTFSLILCFTALLVNTKTNAQTPTYDLKFSRAIIVGSGEQTVPNDAVWKVTSIYGEEINFCVPTDCWGSGTYFYGKGIVSGIYVNSILIPSSIRGFKSANNVGFINNTCTGTNSTSSSYDNCPNKTSDPNILPLWLPAGTTLKSGGPNTFVSVLEFALQ